MLALALLVAVLGSDVGFAQQPWARWALEGDREAALDALDEATASLDGPEPELAYLRARLLLDLGRLEEARGELVQALGAAPHLEPWIRWRLARLEADAGHPEVAAGLLVSLLARNPPESLVDEAVHGFDRALRDGGDCRLLRGLERGPLARDRRIELLRAFCAERDGDPVEARRRRIGLLEDDRDDPVALEAALRLASETASLDEELLLGMTLYGHREFDAAAARLARVLVDPRSSRLFSGSELREARYALARSHFWQGRWRTAAEIFRRVAEESPQPEERSRALYQRGRSLELAGEPEAASVSFLAGRDVDPRGRWADAAGSAALRLADLAGRTEEAEAHLEALRSQRVRRGSLLFLAVSELARGQWERAADRLDRHGGGTEDDPEIAYWRGRLALLAGRSGEAVEAWADLLVAEPDHALGIGVRDELSRAGELRGVAARRAEALADSGSASELLRAVAILDALGEDAAEERVRLRERWGRRPDLRAWLDLEPTPLSRWPLWEADLESPEERLLALGLFDDGVASVPRHFPVSDPGLALAGAEALARAGAHRAALLRLEILEQRRPRDLPPALVPRTLLERLHPLAYEELVVAAARRREVDPHLLAALVREESRFEPSAFSAASARGLAQFVLPTARAVAERSGMGSFEPEDLFDPRFSLELGAAYLGELGELFDERPERMLAAYNAGEAQAELWSTWCLSEDPAEFVTKINFRETKAYVLRVLRSRERVARLHPLPRRSGGEEPGG